MSPTQRSEALAWVATAIFMVGTIAVVVFTAWAFV